MLKVKLFNSFITRVQSYRLMLLLTVITVISGMAFYDRWLPPQEIVGSWSTRGAAVVRYSTGFLSYQFFKDTVNVNVIIAEDGTVTGNVGTAVFTDCKVQENRGWFGKTFNLATDYVIKGTLTGSMFPKDSIAVKEISAPFNIKQGKIKGSCFNMCGFFDYYPFAPFNLEKKSETP